MKTKDKKPFLNMDERNRQVAGRIIAIMYFLTIISMQFIVIYRQFVLGQELPGTIRQADHRICCYRNYDGIFRPLLLPGKKKAGERTGIK